MSKFAIRLLTLAMYATSLPVIPMVTPAKAETSSSKQIKKHKKNIQRSPGTRDPWSAGQARSVQATPEASSVGRGLLHSMTILIEKIQGLTGVCKLTAHVKAP
jgi:hypothetical protein